VHFYRCILRLRISTSLAWVKVKESKEIWTMLMKSQQKIPYYFIANFAENYSFSFVFSLCLVNFSYRDASLC
jgi:hypothetical protein